MSRRRSLRAGGSRNPRSFSLIGSSYARRQRVEALEDRRMLAVLTVTNLNDAGVGSLRQAIADANGTAGVADDIVFRAGIGGTINLASQLPTITDDLTINGGNEITLDAGKGTDGVISSGSPDGFRIFYINAGNNGNQLDVTITDLTLTGADSQAAGGAIRNHEDLTVDRLNVVNNRATFGGALVNFGPSGGTAVANLTSSTFSANTASTSGDSIWNNNDYSSATLTLNSTIVSSTVDNDANLTGDHNLF